MKIWGTQPKSIDDAEDRDKWYEILTKLDIKQPPGGMCTDEASALNQSKKLGFPVMVRPSFVLGGRAMEIVYRCTHQACATRIAFIEIDKTLSTVNTNPEYAQLYIPHFFVNYSPIYTLSFVSCEFVLVYGSLLGMKKKDTGGCCGLRWQTLSRGCS